MYQYVLLKTLPYEGMWILGVVSTLDEALEYFSIKIKKSEDENLDYFSYWVEEWNKTKRLRTYEYNTRTCLLEKQEPRCGELQE